MAFDPDEYLKEPFDPDAYLAEGPALSKKLSVGTKQAFANLGNVVDTAGSSLAGAAMSPFSTDTADSIYRSMNEREKTRNQWANPDKIDVGWEGKLAGALNPLTLPAQVATFPLSPFTTGKTATDSGETTGKALGAIGLDVTGNVVGSLIGPGKTIYASIAKQSGANAAQDYITKWATQQLMDTKAGKEAFNPTLVDAVVSGIVGGGMGAATHQPTKKVAGADVSGAYKELSTPPAKEGAPTPDVWQKIRDLEFAKKQALETTHKARLQEQIDSIKSGQRPIEVDSQGVARPTYEGGVDESGLVNPYAKGTPDALMAHQEEARLAGDTARMRDATQPEMFEGLDHGYGPNPYDVGDAAHWVKDENGIPIRADLSMEASNLENPLQRNLWGDELGQKHHQEAPSSLTQAIDKMPDLPWVGERDRGIALLKPPLGSAARKGLMKKQGGQIHESLLTLGVDSIIRKLKSNPSATQPMRRLMGLFKGTFEEGAIRDAYNNSLDPDSRQRIYMMSPDQFLTLAKRREPWEVASKDSDKRRTSIKEGLAGEAGLRQLPELHVNAKGEIIGHEGRHRAEVLASKLDLIPVVMESSTHRNSDGALPFERLQPQDAWGSPSKFGTPLISPENRAAHDYSEAPKVPFNFKKQGGGIRLDFSKKKEHDTLSKIPGLKQSLGDILPDQRTTEQFLKAEANTKDVSQNTVQKLINNFTKGGVYQAIKTGNPLIKRVVDKVLEANNTARGQVAYWVHDKLAPAAMDLSKTEKADIWAMQVLAEKNKAPLTPEFLAKHGFNEKQIKWVTTHGDVMKAMLDKMNAAMDSMGKEHISPATAYLASRASGDFRRLVYKEVNGKQEPVSILGANTRSRLNSDVKKLQAMHPEWIVGEERFFGGGKRGGTAEGFTQMLELIGKDNPDVKILAEHVNELLTKDAFDYMGAKTHTMAKKGIEGMTGRKVFEDAITNAEEGMKAQISYAEKMIEWAEMSRAVKEIQPLLKEDNGLKMPAAKEWSRGYLQQALGNNPSSVGRAIDNAFAEAFKSMGVGPTLVGQAPAVAKRAINGILLGFINIPFQAMNLLQPFKSQPEMMAFLKGRGIEKSFDAGTGYRYLADAIRTAWAEVDGKALPAYKAEALKYARDKHVYSSDLFDASSRVSKDFGHYWDKATQIGASSIEMRSRQITFLSYVDLLHENGLTKADGLYEAAHRLTDIQMNNYNHVEAPKAYMVAGGVGKTAYNLMSYKHNEYSRLAMLANEIGRSGTSKPLLANIAASIAFAGVMGTIGYSEADALVKFISDKMGKPTSITKILLDNPEIPDNLKYGMGASAGVDLSSRLGLGPMVPQSGIDAVMPGAGKLVNIASTSFEAITRPNEFNTKNAIREALPNSVGGLLDREWFSKPKADGNELALSRNTGKPTATRNDTDKIYKSFGFTGLNEAKQKAKNFEEGRINKVYAEKQLAAIDYATKAYNITGKIPDDFATRYVKAQGDPTKFEAMLNKMVLEGAIDQQTAQKLYAASSNSITSTHKLLRLIGQE